MCKECIELTCRGTLRNLLDHLSESETRALLNKQCELFVAYYVARNNYRETFAIDVYYALRAYLAS
jgi:hypothetical protein